MKNLNIKDIAKIAGVGVATVSRVLNNQCDVKDETRQKILEVMEQHSYIPNNSARNLKRNTSNNIGILVKGIHNPFFSKMIKSIEEVIDKEGHSMILHYNDNNNNDIDAAVELIKEKRLKGLICLGGDFENLDKEELVSLKTPIVLASTYVIEKANKTMFSSVIIENEAAAFKAVDYIASLGHEKIGIITTGEEDRTIGKLRFEGYKKALKKNNIHHADQAHGRAADRLPDRKRREGTLPAQRCGNRRAGRDSARPAAGRIRCAGRHQPAARGAGHSRGVAGGDSGRRQGRLLALRAQPDPDDWSGCPQPERPGDSVCRPDHRLDEDGDGRNRAPAQ